MDEHTEPGLKTKKNKPFVELILIVLIGMMLLFRLTRKETPMTFVVEPQVVQVPEDPVVPTLVQPQPTVALITEPQVKLEPEPIAKPLAKKVAHANPSKKKIAKKIAKKETKNIRKEKQAGVAKKESAPVIVQNWNDKLLLEQSYRREGLFLNAEMEMADLNKAEREGKLHFSPENQVLFTIEQGKLNFDQGRFQESLPYFEKVSQLNPNNETNLKYLAQAQYRTGDFNGSAGTYGKIVQSNPKDMSSQLYQGMALFEAGKQTEAQIVIENTIKQGAESGSGYYYLARIQQRKGNTQSAVDFCEKALKVDPNNAKVSDLLKQLKTKTAG